MYKNSDHKLCMNEKNICVNGWYKNYVIKLYYKNYVHRFLFIGDAEKKKHMHKLYAHIVLYDNRILCS